MTPKGVEVAFAGGPLAARIGEAPGVGGDLSQPFRQRPLTAGECGFERRDDCGCH
jgi:hypothetical protein